MHPARLQAAAMKGVLMMVGGVGSLELILILIYIVIPAALVVAALFLLAYLVGRVIRKSRDTEKDALDKLARLRELRDGGVLSPAEYEDWRRSILEKAGRC